MYILSVGFLVQPPKKIFTHNASVIEWYGIVIVVFYTFNLY